MVGLPSIYTSLPTTLLEGVSFIALPLLYNQRVLSHEPVPLTVIYTGEWLAFGGHHPWLVYFVVRPLAPSTPRGFAPGRLRHFFGRDFSLFPFTHSVLAWCDDTGPLHALRGEAPFEPPEPTRGCWAFEAPIPARNFQDPIVSVVRHREPSPQHNL